MCAYIIILRRKFNIMYDFNKIIDRKGTSSWKYDFYKEYNKPSDTLSMWIADMDFPTVPEVVKKMEDVATFGIYGYSRPMSGYYEASGFKILWL